LTNVLIAVINIALFVGGKMAHHKDALKRIKQSEIRRIKNKHYRSRVKTYMKNAISLKEDSYEKRVAAFRLAEREIMHARTKGIYHNNTASRMVSRLARALAITN